MMEELTRIIQRVAEALKLDSKAGEYAMLQVFDVILPSRYKGQAKANRIFYKGRNAILEVHVASPLMAQELSFERTSLLERMNTYSPQTGIALQDLIIRSR
jgi:hypothetical protein